MLKKKKISYAQMLRFFSSSFFDNYGKFMRTEFSLYKDRKRILYYHLIRKKWETKEKNNK